MQQETWYTQLSDWLSQAMAEPTSLALLLASVIGVALVGAWTIAWVSGK